MDEEALFLEFSIGVFLWRGNQDESNGGKCVLKVYQCVLKANGGIMHHVKCASLIVLSDALLRLIMEARKGSHIGSLAYERLTNAY